MVCRSPYFLGISKSTNVAGLYPPIFYGGGDAPQTINIRYNELVKHLKAGRFLSTLLNVKVAPAPALPKGRGW